MDDGENNDSKRVLTVFTWLWWTDNKSMLVAKETMIQCVE